jgi:hypothetical protein
MSRKVNLQINSKSVDLNPFVEGYVYHIAVGIINSLKDTKPIKTLDLDIDSDGLLTITLNGEGVPVNEFVMEIVRNTFTGLVSNLKGVDEAMSTLSLSIKQ